MAEVDASIYGKFVQPDPLGLMKDVTDLSSAMESNKLLQMQVLAKQQLGKAVQEATDPVTGAVDQAKLSEILRRPENYAAAAEGATLGLTLQGQQLTNTGFDLANQKSGIDLSNSAFDNLGAAWGARLSRTTGPVKAADFQTDVVDLLAQGRITPQVAKAVLNGMPDDSEELKGWLAGGYLQTLGVPGMVAPTTAPPGPSGAPRAQTTGQAVSQSLGVTQPAPVAPPGPGEASPAPAPGPGYDIGLSPGAAAALPVVGKGAGDASLRLSALAAEVPTRKAMLDNMLADAEDFTSGPMSEDIKTFTSGINQLFGTHINIEGVAAQERFDKIANQIALQQSGDLGITDLTTTTAMGANPNSRMSNLGIKGVIALLKGNEDAIQLKHELWQDYLDGGGSPEDYFSWSRDFNKNFDPRVFQTVYLTPEERQAMLKGLKPSEIARFKERYNFAVENGWIPDPRR